MSTAATAALVLIIRLPPSSKKHNLHCQANYRQLSCEIKEHGGRGCCCSDHPVALCLRERQLWQGAQGQDNQAIYRLGDENQSVLCKVLAKLSLSSSKKRKLQKDSGSREPGGKTTNHQAMNIKTRSSSTKVAAVQNNCCPTATIV